jgi:hypothetical protein
MELMMASDATVEVMGCRTQTAERLHEQDEKATAVAQRERTQGTTLPLEQILDRETDTRPVLRQHVTQLAESIRGFSWNICCNH